MNVDVAETGELTAGLLAAGQSTHAGQATLSTEEKVKQHFEQMREPLARYLAGTFGGERASARHNRV